MDRREWHKNHSHTIFRILNVISLHFMSVRFDAQPFSSLSVISLLCKITAFPGSVP